MMLVDDVFRFRLPINALVCVVMLAPAHADLLVWTAHGSAKIFRDSTPRVLPPSGIVLSAARNEHVAAQLVVTAGDRPLHRVDVTLSALRDAAGHELPAEAISLRRVAYVHLPARDRDYPDPMPPLAPFDVVAGQNQPIWLSCVVPRSARPGVYRGIATIVVGEVTSRTVPVQLRVWSFISARRPNLAQRVHAQRSVSRT